MLTETLALNMYNSSLSANKIFLCTNRFTEYIQLKVSKNKYAELYEFFLPVYYYYAHGRFYCVGGIIGLCHNCWAIMSTKLLTQLVGQPEVYIFTIFSVLFLFVELIKGLIFKSQATAIWLYLRLR